MPAVEICSDRSAAGMAAGKRSKASVGGEKKTQDSFALWKKWHGFCVRKGRGYYVVTFLSQRDPVVLQKDDFETVADHWIVVDHLADGCDQADDHLCGVVSRSRLHQAIGKR